MPFISYVKEKNHKNNGINHAVDHEVLVICSDYVFNKLLFLVDVFGIKLIPQIKILENIKTHEVKLSINLWLPLMLDDLII